MARKSVSLVGFVALLAGLIVVCSTSPASAAKARTSAARESTARTSVVFTPVADTFVDAAAPDANQGTRLYTKADNSPVERVYLRFDVRGVGSADSATLKIYAEGSQRNGVDISPVADNGWGETTLTYNNAPAIGASIYNTGAIAAGTWITVDVSSLVSGDGLYTFALTTNGDTAIRFTSREGVKKPQLVVPGDPSPSPFVIDKVGSEYHAVSQTTGIGYQGTLKFVGESAVADLEAAGGGEVRFAAGTFDFGSEFFHFQTPVHDITFQGAGIDETVIQNYSTEPADTEPFNFTGTFNVTIRDLTVSAGGSDRPTSDALDFDEGNDSLVERVKVIASRGRGIVFDGKNLDWVSKGNTVRDCVISNVRSDGIELLASSENTVRDCAISEVGGHGIQLVKSSSGADQPNKKPEDNLIVGNVIAQAGQDGVNVFGGDRNKIVDNVITDSSDDTSGRDGIRLTSGDSITCEGNEVTGDRATDDQSPKTQKYGLHIMSPLCSATVVGLGNDFAGNLVAPIRDVGTGTVFL